MRNPDRLRSAAMPAPADAAAQTSAVGLSGAEVARRRERGLAAGSAERASRSVSEILRANVLTRFNCILGVLLAVIPVVGRPRRMACLASS